jgi:ubiquinone/menaquinone biosynthesis C-methylase UbiE
MAQQIEKAQDSAADPIWGHHWKESDRVREYVERTDREAAQRAESFKLLVGVVPFEPEQSVRILDVGSGHGVVAAALLDRFPKASAVGLDVSEAMMEVGRQRMAQYGSRFGYHLGDFAGGALPSGLPGPFDVVTSARAIHHLPADVKAALYRSIFDVVAPGGCFLNLDIVGPHDEYLQDIYRQASTFVNGPRPNPPRPANQPSIHGHFPDPIADHLGFLSAAGFAPVDCFWQNLGNALLGGFKRR